MQNNLVEKAIHRTYIYGICIQRSQRRSFANKKAETYSTGRHFQRLEKLHSMEKAYFGPKCIDSEFSDSEQALHYKSLFRRF
jgi:hypothetical protein